MVTKRLHGGASAESPECRPRRSGNAVTRSLVLAVAAFGCAACSEIAKPPAGSPEGPGPSTTPAAASSDRKPRSRSFRFDYDFTIKGIPAGAQVRVWMPVPPSNRDQTVVELARELPATASLATESVHGNRIMYLDAKPSASGELACRVSYRVTRKEARGLVESKPPDEIAAAQRRTYLAANANVPLGGKPILLLAGMSLKKDRLRLAKQFYDLVDGYVTYDKSQPGYGRGDAVWVCDSRRGNCSDFHSLFISLARSKGIPARFEIGFPLPEKQGKGNVSGYHCWAYFFVEDRGWVPVDISEANKHPAMKDYYFGNLTENRIAFSTGRDLVLVPRQAAKPLNFFIDPHVEVNGKTWPLEKIDRQYSFQDL